MHFEKLRAGASRNPSWARLGFVTNCSDVRQSFVKIRLKKSSWFSGKKTALERRFFVLTELEFGLRFAESADEMRINYDLGVAQYVHG
uniref:Uncharacterized protein n=1 Tax=Pseudomonas syringae TaxID=317 RepID=I3W2K2_PSESX|nr:hypothetical protein [Pseudomonas syringae]AFK89829.1 hypothetical protein [Pseudomonas syringae]